MANEIVLMIISKLMDRIFPTQCNKTSKQILSCSFGHFNRKNSNVTIWLNLDSQLMRVPLQFVKKLELEILKMLEYGSFESPVQ